MNVKSPFRKILILFLILSMVLVSCDVQGPEPIGWDGNEKTNMGETTLQPLDVDTLRVVCEQDEIRREQCNGDDNYGFDTTHAGTTYYHIDGECYVPSGHTTGEGIVAIKNAISVIEKLKEDSVFNLGTTILGTGGTYSAIMALTAKGCVGTGGWTGGAGCIPLAIVAAAAVGITLLEFIDVTVSYIKIRNEKAYLNELIQDVNLIRCGE